MTPSFRLWVVGLILPAHKLGAYPRGLFGRVCGRPFCEVELLLYGVLGSRATRGSHGQCLGAHLGEPAHGRGAEAASAAGRDVASLGAIARDADNRVGTIYSWYASAKHVGGVAGAGMAGLIISASGDGFQLLFAVVLALSALPTVGVWFGLREVRDEETVTDEPTLPPSRRRSFSAAG